METEMDQNSQQQTNDANEKKSQWLICNACHQVLLCDGVADSSFNSGAIVCDQCQDFYQHSINNGSHSQYECICNNNNLSLCNCCRFDQITKIRLNYYEQNKMEKTCLDAQRCKQESDIISSSTKIVRRFETITGGYATGPQLNSTYQNSIKPENQQQQQVASSSACSNSISLNKVTVVQNWQVYSQHPESLTKVNVGHEGMTIKQSFSSTTTSATASNNMSLVIHNPDNQQQKQSKIVIKKPMKKVILLPSSSLTMLPLVQIPSTSSNSDKDTNQQASLPSNMTPTCHPLVLLQQESNVQRLLKSKNNEHDQHSSTKLAIIKSSSSLASIPKYHVLEIKPSCGSSSNDDNGSSSGNNNNSPIDGKIIAMKTAVQKQSPNIKQKNNSFIKYRKLAPKVNTTNIVTNPTMTLSDVCLSNQSESQQKQEIRNCPFTAIIAPQQSTCFSVILDEKDLQKKLSQGLSSLDSERISKYRCPLEELFHNWTFFVDHVNLIYWSCFGSASSQHISGLYLRNSASSDYRTIIEVFIQKFWTFINDFLKLFRTDQVSDHAIISLVQTSVSQSATQSLSTTQMLSLLHICWIKLSIQQGPQEDHEWWHHIKSLWKFEETDPRRSRLLRESFENITRIAGQFQINDIEMALISTIFMLKWTKMKSSRLEDEHKNCWDGSLTSCHICHRPLLRMEQLFTTILEMFVDDQSSTFGSQINQQQTKQQPCGFNQSIQLMLLLLPEMEYFFTLFHVT